MMTAPTEAGREACIQCGRNLGNSPSEDFCSEDCQQVWRARNVTVVPGYEVLDRVHEFVARFNVFPSEHCAPMLALWYAHTHAADPSTSRLGSFFSVLSRDRARHEFWKWPNFSCEHRK